MGKLKRTECMLVRFVKQMKDILNVQPDGIDPPQDVVVNRRSTAAEFLVDCELWKVFTCMECHGVLV